MIPSRGKLVIRVLSKKVSMETEVLGAKINTVAKRMQIRVRRVT